MCVASKSFKVNPRDNKLQASRSHSRVMNVVGLGRYVPYFLAKAKSPLM